MNPPVAPSLLSTDPFGLSTPVPFPQGGNGSLGLAMAILFSPLIAVGAFSVSTLARVVPQAADGKDFFPKDTLPF